LLYATSVILKLKSPLSKRHKTSNVVGIITAFISFF
jgi:hypothetical protein